MLDGIVILCNLWTRRMMEVVGILANVIVRVADGSKFIKNVTVSCFNEEQYGEKIDVELTMHCHKHSPCAS